MRALHLTAVTKQERHTSTTLVMDEVVAQGGWVEDVHLYSNIMTTINFAMPVNRIAGFIAALARHGIQADGTRAEQLNDAEESETQGSLQLTFFHSEPDLKREIPHMPG